MTSDKSPITIKKYANRRLYNTGTSAYVTLEDLAVMVKRGEDFVVFDAKTGEEITRSVLTQIIFEQEGKGGQSLLPIAFLRQLIRFYGDSMQMMVPSYLEFSLDKLTAEQGAFRDQCADAFGVAPLANVAKPIIGQIEEQTRKNMAMFRQALSMFPAFTPPGMAPAPAAPAKPPVAPAAPEPQAPQTRDEFEALKQQLDELHKRLDGMIARD
ncbi:polyhydroxyalkanoate synthesis repressor PhaR [Beijerinckia sp. L45]|uniref:polyhydroxyalkanoate synthesis repressor PhaR n=1 Tax=Beijerinckia sp. L45 TaxID=1641855 RepID=UPI00131D1A95|nr:polyhydroxyalkanoate synthesis repressor PhaR [Beijerinckia sp. L45]